MNSGFRVGGDAYDDFMGRYSTVPAQLFADFAGVETGMRALDVGAGTGALTAELLARGATDAPAAVAEMTRVARRVAACMWVASLDGEKRERAREELSRQLGSPSGPFELGARAFSVGVAPA